MGQIVVSDLLKSEGQTYSAADLNAYINRVAAFLNGANLGNENFSPDAAQRLSALKILFDVVSHGSTHEPDGADEVHDIDLGGSGTKATLHGPRHSFGGADPLVAGSQPGSVFKDATFTDLKLQRGRSRETVAVTDFAVTFVDEPWKLYTLSPVSAAPTGRGVVRSGKLYFGCFGNDSIVEINLSTGASSMIAGAGADPRDLLLIGTNIYFVTETGVELRKLDINNAITSVLSWNSGASPGTITKVRGLAVNSDGTVVYTIGADGTGLIAILLRATLATPTVTHASDLYPGSGTHQDCTVPHFVKDGANEYIVTQDSRREVAGTARALYRRSAATLAAVDLFESVVALNAAHCEASDGHLLYILEGSTTHVYDVVGATLYKVADLTAPTGNSVDTARNNTGFFDGRYICLGAHLAATPVATPLIIPFQYLGGGVIPKCHSGASVVTTGFASDGVSIYVAMANGALDASVRRIPL